MENPTPSFGSIYSNDAALRSFVNLAIGSVIFHFFVYIGGGESYPPMSFMFWMLTAVSVIAAVARYIQVVSTFRNGVTVMGNVGYINRSVSTSKEGKRRQSYHANILYKVGNESFNTRIRLPDDPALYGISQGSEVEILLKEDKPKTIFVKSIYL